MPHAPPFINMREKGLFVFRENIKEVERKVAAAEAKWKACGVNSSKETLQDALFSMIQAKSELEEMKRNMAAYSNPSF